MLRIARTGAVKAKTAASNTLLGLIVTAPEPLRSQLRELSTANLTDPVQARQDLVAGPRELVHGL